MLPDCHYIPPHDHIHGTVMTLLTAMQQFLASSTLKGCVSIKRRTRTHTGLHRVACLTLPFCLCFLIIFIFISQSALRKRHRRRELMFFWFFFKIAVFISSDFCQTDYLNIHWTDLRWISGAGRNMAVPFRGKLPWQQYDAIVAMTSLHSVRIFTLLLHGFISPQNLLW